ncbi:MAG: protein-glutamate O-methyltransferase CheR [Limnochordales bacterium]|nr:protein-glutamate O-methyltransferase CheR [Limnochordales bacterium]
MTEDVSRPPAGFALFAETVRELLGLDITAYNPRQLYRRLAGQLRRVGCTDLAAYAELVRQDRARAAELWTLLTINVSEFFRDPALWDTLGQRILPSLVDERRSVLRMWSAGCSIGAEAYSLAILATELALPLPFRILATDIDPDALAQAMSGRYRSHEMAGLSESRRRRFFRPVKVSVPGRGGKETAEVVWEVLPEIRERVRFRQHNLLADPYPTGMDLILCRNVVIYFTPKAKQQVQQRLAQSLRPGGVLFVGGTETLLQPAALGLEPIAPFFYRKKTGSLVSTQSAADFGLI